MEALIFCGIQGSGKTTFYQQNFLKTHIRLSLDLLHTRNKEMQFLLTCFATQQRFVIDNTNPTRRERKKYIDLCKAYRFNLTGYYFDSPVADALVRNGLRQGKECIPDKGLIATYKKLEIPTCQEGYDQLYRVTILHQQFIVEAMDAPSAV